MLTTYSGSGCTGLVSNRIVVLVACPPQDELIAAMWPPVLRNDLPALIMVLTSRGLSNLPAFAITQIGEGEVLVLMRGRIRVDAYRGDQLLESMMANTVTTWHESSFVGADRVVLADGQATGAAASGVALPLVGGVVPAAILERQVTSSATKVEPRLKPQAQPYPVPLENMATHQVPAPRKAAEESHTKNWVEPGTHSGAPPAAPPPAPPAAPPARPPARSPSGMLDRLFTDDDAAKPASASMGAPMGSVLGEIRFDSHYGDTEMGGRRRPNAATGNLVPAVRCPQLHLNPPAIPACRECQVPIDPGRMPEMVPQPSVGWLRRVDTNQRWPISRPSTLLGRSVSSPGRVDQLSIVVDGPGATVSDLHAEILLDGWRVEVIDRSEHGTFVINPGGKKERLVPGSTARLLLGGRVILADEVTFQFEVT